MLKNEYLFFRVEEFNCPCCGKNNISPILMHRLDMARGIANTKFPINSGCRCEKHNKEVGGVEQSPHLGGWAADISAKTSRDKFRIVKALIDAGFNRIGIGDTFVHADVDPTKVGELLWTY